jgi:hypothetical protein
MTSSTLDLIDSRIRETVNVGNMKPETRHTRDWPSSQVQWRRDMARIDIDYADASSVAGPGERWYYRIRKGRAFKPVATIAVFMKGSGSYFVDIHDGPTPQPDTKPGKNGAFMGDRGWLADELDVPMEMVEKYILDVLDGVIS